MKKSKLFMAVVATMTMGVGIAHAQTTFSIGSAFPVGDFAAKSATTNALLETTGATGGAATGLSAGLKYQGGLPIFGLSVMGTVDVMWNKLSDEVMHGITNKDITMPNYINVPLMVGLNYELPITLFLSLYAEAGIGCNARFLTKMKSDVMNTSVTYDPAFSLAYQFGLGIKITRLVLSANYYCLGAAPVKGDVSSTAYSANNQTFGEVTPDLVTLRVGFEF